MAPRAPQISLKKWGKQKWRTPSGRPSTQGPLATGERYMPAEAVGGLSAKERAATTRAKRKDTKAGIQHSSQPKKIAKKIKKYRT
jgi:hypothetical protein|tara:strand:- start:1563 stop:1817 length:255 start_codon:yes stop_codon:yes gene_type:complete